MDFSTNLSSPIELQFSEHPSPQTITISDESANTIATLNEYGEITLSPGYTVEQALKIVVEAVTHMKFKER